MQPIDAEDRQRSTKAKIAASIRAAILAGEFEPGEALPSGNDLAEFFGVTRVTVQNAVALLGTEGYVTSRSGSGVYVNDQVHLPGPADADHPMSGVVDYLHEMGHLKQVPRSGWMLLGIPSPESVAEHSFRVAAVGICLAALEGADVGQVAAMCVLHDAHETRIGDVPSVGRAYVKTAAPEAVTAHQTAGMPAEAASAVRGLVAEFEATESPESRVAHDADKIECLLQAAEYQAQGYATQPWIDSSVASLRTEAAKHLAQAIISGDPGNWWSGFAASYRELRATTRGDAQR